MFTAAATATSIAIIHPAPGNETPAKAGSVLRKPREPTWNDRPSAITWVINGSTTTVRSAAAFHNLPAGRVMSADFRNLPAGRAMPAAFHNRPAGRALAA